MGLYKYVVIALRTPRSSNFDWTAELEQQINEAKENCEYNVAAIEIARTGGTVPQVDTALSIAQADAMVRLI